MKVNRLDKTGFEGILASTAKLLLGAGSNSASTRKALSVSGNIIYIIYILEK